MAAAIEVRNWIKSRPLNLSLFEDDMLRSREFVISLLLRESWSAASYLGGVKPIEMVAQCIANRVRLGWGSWHDVLDDLPIYSSLDPARAIADRPRLPASNDPRFLMLLSAMDKVYDNSGENLVGAGVFWADVTKLSHAWFISNVVNGSDHRRVAQNGTLVVWD